MFNYKKFGEGVRYYRKKNGLTIQALAENPIVDTEPPYLTEVEQGKRRPSLKMIVSICNALNVGVNDCLQVPDDTGKVLYKQFKAKVLNISEYEQKVVLAALQSIRKVGLE